MDDLIAGAAAEAAQKAGAADAATGTGETTGAAAPAGSGETASPPPAPPAPGAAKADKAPAKTGKKAEKKADKSRDMTLADVEASDADAEFSVIWCFPGHQHRAINGLYLLVRAEVLAALRAGKARLATAAEIAEFTAANGVED